MCGIAGIVRLDGKDVDPSALDTLTDALEHRGPDSRGTFIAGNVGLGHRRLKIIDLSEAAAQPMRTTDGQFTIVFNGEIHNFVEKRKLLETRGFRFRSQSDTEVLLGLYQEFGEKCLEHLRGQFAFAILDRESNRLFLARDRVGKKPIKYFLQGKTFAFASELKALRTLSECPGDIDWEAAHHYLTMMYVPSPATGIYGIHKLPAGHAMVLDLNTGSLHTHRYWQLNYTTDSTRTVDQWKRDILSVFEESVRLRTVADVPVGAFLSGGIDSAAVVATMAKSSSHPIETFSIGSPEETHNELPDAERIAKLLNTNHHPITLTPDIVHLLPELVRTYEEPYADPSAIPTYLLARETKKSVTVALNGDGGDENFFGYARYPIFAFSQRWAEMQWAHPLANAFTNFYHNARQSTHSYRCLRFQQTINQPWPERFLQYISFFTEDEKRSLYVDGFGKNYLPTGAWYAAHTAAARARASDPLHQAMSMDIDTYLADDLMPKVDLGSMAWGLEARSPLLDHNLLELTARIPASLKLRGLTRKWIFKQMLRGTLPHETLSKRKKGFRLPLDRWMRTSLKPFVVDTLFQTDSPLPAMVDRKKLETFLAQYYAGSVDYSDHVWALLWLTEWLKQYT